MFLGRQQYVAWLGTGEAKKVLQTRQKDILNNLTGSCLLLPCQIKFASMLSSSLSLLLIL